MPMLLESWVHPFDILPIVSYFSKQKTSLFDLITCFWRVVLPLKEI